MVITSKDADRICEILQEAARREILPRFRNLASGAIREKTSALDVVTDADEAAEHWITAELLKAFPGAVIIGEEAAEKNPALLDDIDGIDLAFVVDPVDGTINFASGLPLFGVMAAAIVRGEIVAGVIHDPMGGDFTVGMRGEGAWTRAASGARSDLRVASPAPVHQMNGVVSWAPLPEPLRSTVTANLSRIAAGYTYRCAAHEYRLAAGGHCHFLLFGKLMPWDHAPGWLIHREAGGYAARFDGSAYRPSLHSGGLLCAPDEASWRELHDALLVAD
jgi:fructose-1,6-bisphosphatase/inositol monophosphatase family enzyme